MLTVTPRVTVFISLSPPPLPFQTCFFHSLLPLLYPLSFAPSFILFFLYFHRLAVVHSLLPLLCCSFLLFFHSLLPLSCSSLSIFLSFSSSSALLVFRSVLSFILFLLFCAESHPPLLSFSSSSSLLVILFFSFSSCSAQRINFLSFSYFILFFFCGARSFFFFSPPFL